MCFGQLKSGPEFVAVRVAEAARIVRSLEIVINSMRAQLSVFPLI